jgi:hypothetical protein
MSVAKGDGAAAWCKCRVRMGLGRWLARWRERGGGDTLRGTQRHVKSWNPSCEYANHTTSQQALHTVTLANGSHATGDEHTSTPSLPRILVSTIRTFLNCIAFLRMSADALHTCPCRYTLQAPHWPLPGDPATPLYERHSYELYPYYT